MATPDERAPAAGPPRACPNCGAPAPGRYCPACGQDNAHDRLRARVLVAEQLANVLGVESRLARTLRGLLSDPGGLVLDYVGGRRARYVSPARFALLSLVLWIVASRAAGVDALAASGVRIDQGGALQSAVRGLLDRHLDMFLYLSLPARALALKLLFRRHRLYLAEELVLVLYLVGTGYVFALAALPLQAAGLAGAFQARQLAGLFWFVWAVRRVHGTGWWTAAWRGTAATVLHAIAIFLLMAAVAVPWVLARR